MTTSVTQASLVSIGYEGRTAVDVIRDLRAADVATLVDVRLTPVSRKPGMSKRRLHEALTAVGIDYIHLPALGNPKDSRDLFRRGDPDSRQRYRQILRSPAGRDALGNVKERLDRGVVALLCFERDHDSCHRGGVSSELLEAIPDLQIRHL